ncbi:unnamed protein product [Durusdinium trenchii]|uniref:Integrase catalytic domain-containing protein n=1 Tax=Durusdinium trenchii TaxID=1381693 RepID=A0ABP0Q7B6_9DINO
MATGGGDEKGAWYQVPTWDGSPLTWRSFRREMTWWVSSLDLQATAKYNLAARWLLRQTGIVRQRGEEFNPDELQFKPAETYTDPVSGEPVEVTPADYLFGLNKLLTALEAINGQSLLDKRGELRNLFYLELKRSPNERVAEFCTRFRTLAADLSAEGVSIQSTELGWFLRQKLGLDSLRQQLLETALGGREEYNVVEAECLRLFKDLHHNDPLRRFDRQGDRPKLTIRRLFQSQSQKGPSSSASTISRSPSMFSAATSARSSNSTSTRRAYVTETDDGHDQSHEEVLETVAEEDHAGEQAADPTLEEVIQSEAECLATELQEAEEQGIDPGVLEEMESSFEQAAEALVTMKEAKSRLQEVRKDRGFGRAGAVGGGRQNAGVPAARKASGKHPCFDCNQHGHWAGDKECPKPGAGLGRKGPPAAAKAKTRQVRVTEAFQAEHVVVPEPLAPSPSSTSTPLENPGSPHEVNMVLHGSSTMPLGQAFEQSLANALNSTLVSTAAQDLPNEKHHVGALDSACNRSCAGPTWLQSYVSQLESAPPYRSFVLYFTMSPNRSDSSSATEVPIPSLGCLLGRDVLDALGAVLNFGQRTLQCTSLFDDSQRLELKHMAAGHFMLELLPESWPRLGPVKWRRCGLDGVLELQLTPRSWLERRVAEARCLTSHCHFIDAFSDYQSDYLQNDLKYQFMMISPPTSTFLSDMAALEAAPLEPLTPSLVKIFKEVNTKGIVPYRWNRFILRLVDRRNWHARSLLIQFASRAHLRYLPFPYPSVCSVEQWLLQAQSMINMKTMSRRHHFIALETGGYTVEHLLELGRLRDRCGWKMAFVEDSLLAGFLAARSQKGQREKLRAAALEETKQKIAKESAEMDREIMARQLLGPRGGLPTLRSDLVKLALLLNLTPGPKETVAQLQGRIRPLVDILKNKNPPLHSTPLEVPRADPLHRVTPTSSSWSAVSGMEAPKAAMERKQEGCPMPSELHQMEVRVQEMMKAQDARFQAMLGASSVSKRGSFSGAIRGGNHISERCGHGPDQGRPVKNFDDLVDTVDGNFKIHGKVKKGISQMISQAWHQHRRDQIALSVGLKEIKEVFMATWNMEMRDAMNETFAVELRMPTFLTEVYTDTEPVAQATRRHGLVAGESLTLGTGWDFRLPDHCKAALAWMKRVKPYVVVLAFPCGAWSQLLALNASVDLDRLRSEAFELVFFAIEVARLQLRGGRHYLMENPRSSMAWKLEIMEDFVQSTGALEVVVDMCRFGLRAPDGELHKKATKLVTSMQALVSAFLDKRCLGDHRHTPVIGGKKISTAAGHYTKDFADAVVDACMQQYDFENAYIFKGYNHESEAFTVEHEVMAVGDDGDLDSEASFEVSKDDEQKPISAAVKNAVYRLHVNTSHRSNQRLAKALLICGAPKEAVLAAKRLKCPVCAERRNPKPRPGREFVSAEFGDWCDSQSIYLYHIGVGAPWQNGICERSGATLKALVGAVAQSHAIGSFEEMELTVGEAVASYNSDLNEGGVAPIQLVTGKIPSPGGDVLNSFNARLSEHSLIEAKPTLSKLVAIRETARLSMIRLHYSRGLRQAELSRSRATTGEDLPQPGDLVFFWRAQKYQSRKDVGAGTRRRLMLRRWHGPGLLVATEGRHGTDLAANCFVSFCGQLTKCPLEHVRKASSLESIAAGSWEAAIDEVINAAKNEARAREHDDGSDEPEPDGPLRPSTPEQFAGQLQPSEIVAALQPPSSAAPSLVGRTAPPSLLETAGEGTETPGTAAPGTPVPSLILQASQSRLTSPMASSTMSRTLERARALDEEVAERAERGVKRPAEGPPLEAEEHGARPAFEALELTHEELQKISDGADVHPLLKLQAMIDLDRDLGNTMSEPDHGTWDGRWSLICQRDWDTLQRLGAQLPSGAPHDVLALQTARKEYVWSKMSPNQKQLWGEAAVTGWKAYIDNSAVEVLSMHESIRLSMIEYHENLAEVILSRQRKSDPSALLEPHEHRQLRAILGSLQWLVAQLRFDLSFGVSSLQGENPPTVGTMLRANSLVREFKRTGTFELVFRPIDYRSAGIVAVSDAALGNVQLSGSSEGAASEKVYSQACYYILLGDSALVDGKPGQFNVLDTRSHRIPRVCRSTYAAETLAAEEALDAGQLARGFLATVLGKDMLGVRADSSMNAVKMTGVVDAKDVYDKSNSDTASFGSQKSLAFTIAWLRSLLRRPNTALKWTATSNMFADAGTKMMSLDHLRKILSSGTWSISYSPEFQKQVYKAKSAKPSKSSTA